MTFMELFDIHTVIHSFTALETSRVFSIFSCSKQKRLFFSVWTLEVEVTFYSKIIYFTLTFTNVLYCFGLITRLLERIKSANGQFLTSSFYSQEMWLVRYADGDPGVFKRQAEHSGDGHGLWIGRGERAWVKRRQVDL